MGRRLQVVEYMAMIRVCSSALNILEIFICMILQFSDAISKQPLRYGFTLSLFHSFARDGVCHDPTRGQEE